MRRMKFTTVHTRKKHNQCGTCVYHIEATCFTEGGEYVIEFCTCKGHKGIIVQYKDKTERICYDYMEKAPS